MSSGNSSNTGKATNGRKLVVPKRAGGRFFDDTIDDPSSSDSDTGGK
jgi:hypothetical protein